MKLSDFEYVLPEKLIAQHPLHKRDDARLLVIDRVSKKIIHSSFHDLGKHLPAQSLLVVNDSKVIHARLLGQRARSGGQVEVFLLKHLGGRRFEAMLRPLKKIHDNEVLIFAESVSARLIDRAARVVEFDCDDVLSVLEKVGHIPLPPYIKRPDEAADRVDYQTVYAKHAGSVAAPTAGLHFTKILMNSLKREGHSFAEVTLHVNYGTFKPVETENISEHPMHSEDYTIEPPILDAVCHAKASGQKIIAVGTTSARVLESYARTHEPAGSTKLFLYPGAEFRLIDGMVTNFHLPKSTLLMLVSAFGGLDLIKRAYEEAIRAEYRFYSYGDAMLII